MIRCVLFDFDGTLADSAPDLVSATQQLLQAHGKPPADAAVLRNRCSTGARGLLKVAFDVDKEDPAFEPLRQAFLQYYRQCLTDNTRLFDGVFSLLAVLQTRGISWAIVTNKATELTTPIVAHLFPPSGLYTQPVAVICGDTTPHPKPHPAPILAALAAAGCAADQALYLGDDERDILAGQAADCTAIAVTWGYHEATSPPHSWGASAVIDAPIAMLTLLGQ